MTSNKTLYQINVFTDNSFNPDLNSFYSEMSSMPEFSGGANIAMPIGGDAPREIPRIVLQGKDNLHRADISLQKISISWFNPLEDREFVVNKGELIDLSDRLLGKILGSSKIIRIGLVQQYVLEVEDHMLEVKKKLLTNQELTNDLIDYELRLVYKNSLEVFDKCNENIAILSGRKDNSSGKKVILLVSDFNTDQEIKLDWGMSQIFTFINESYEKQNMEELINKFI